MEQGNFIIGTVSAEELIAELVRQGAEIVGDRDHEITYLKNINDENDMKGVVYYVNNFLDFDPDFDDCPKVQVMVGDPRNKKSFVSVTDNAEVQIKSLINNGYEEFCYSTSKDIDVYIPETITGTAGRVVTLVDYIVGDQERGEEYPYSIGATILKDRGCSAHANCALWTSEDIEEILERVLGYSVVVNETDKEIVTAFDVLDLMTKEDEETLQV